MRWLSADLTWTARYQLVRIACAIASASLRSLLTGMARVTARSRRVSMHTMVQPPAVSSPCSQVDSGPASSPTRSIGRPPARIYASSASGSVATLPSRTRRPVSSTMPIAVSSNDTSNPAKYLMAVPRWLDLLLGGSRRRETP